MDQETAAVDRFYDDVAARFEALSMLFAEFSSPLAARELVDALMSDDPGAFNPLVDRIDLPVLNKCFWVREVVERVLDTPSRLVRGDCWVRSPLTRAERDLYLEIALRHRRRPAIASEPIHIVPVGGHLVIPPGPFLDELKENGLTECADDYWTSDSILVPALAPPERVCV